MRRYFGLLLLTLATLACTDRAIPTGPVLHGPSFALADAPHGFTAGFYWLPPLAVPPPNAGGAFDAALSPVVEICKLTGATCGPVLATFTMATGPGSETVRLDLQAEAYLVNWHTHDFDLSAANRYRISVRAGANVLLGYADVQPVETGKGRKAADAGDAAAFVIGQTLPIKFRIETGIPGEVSVTPPEASIAVGKTQQFVATLRDLHGNPISAAVTWSTSKASVAPVDVNGKATGVAPGVATITATAAQASGSATLTVTPPGGIVALAAGGPRTCAVGATGNAYCWGWALSGELGTGSTGAELTPAAVVGGLTFGSITVGNRHICGLTPAGQAYCWGYNAFGQLGTGSDADAFAPLPVAGGLTFASLSAGDSHTCGVTTTGQAYCWGWGMFGTLGTGGTAIAQRTPVAVAGGLSFTSVSAGDSHSCGITTAGTAYCWGAATYGVLGTGSGADQLAPAPVSGGHRFATLSAGPRHTCGVTPAGSAYCWGQNSAGELGIGPSYGVESVPAAVSGGLTFARLSAGEYHTCGVTTAGQAYCWGWGLYGALGTGSMTSQLVPAAVAGGLTFTSISAATEHSCGVTTAGQAYCWGEGNNGRLGTGSTASQLTPAPVAPLP